MLKRVVRVSCVIIKKKNQRLGKIGRLLVGNIYLGEIFHHLCKKKLFLKKYQKNLENKFFFTKEEYRDNVNSIKKKKNEMIERE